MQNIQHVFVVTLDDRVVRIHKTLDKAKEWIKQTYRITRWEENTQWRVPHETLLVDADSHDGRLITVFKEMLQD